jgi:hypothetical protein
MVAVPPISRPVYFLCLAAYCVPGGVRVVSGACGCRVTDYSAIRIYD